MKRATRSNNPSLQIQGSLTRNTPHQKRRRISLVVILWICVFLVVVLLVLTIQTKAVFVMNDDPNAQSTGRRQYHVVFSTSCSPFQNWQSIAFFYFAHRVRQPGHITRLVSGCTAEQAKDLQKVHDQQVAPLSDKYHLHITPDFGHNNQGDEKYWNKPHGLLSFMETELGYSKEKPSTIHDDDVIIILDPDMMLLKPITDDFSDYVGLWKNDLTQVKVQHGKPIAQRYEYGAQWLTTLGKRVEEVVGPRSPVLKMNTTEANLYYPAGPPYLATAKDMYQIATYWVTFLPKIYSIFPQFMAEMHGYSAAAAHLKLPHRLARGFMISTVEGNQEYFAFLDSTLNRTTACEAAAVAAASSTTPPPGMTSSAVVQVSTQQLPYVLHYCQRYALGRYFFSKYKLNEAFFECDAPLMKEPPLNVGDIYDWYIFPNGIETADLSNPSRHSSIVRNGWMMCSLIFGLNDVATSVKQKHCENPNLSKTWHFHEEEKFQHMVDDPSNPFQMEKKGKEKDKS